jgi:hypothetical protein
MLYTIEPVSGISSEQILALAGNSRFVTHANNPCVVDVLKRTFGWEGGTFIVYAAGKKIGVFSCMFVNGTIVSMPHFSYGGLITSLSDRKEVLNSILPLIHSFFGGTHTASNPYLLRDIGPIGNHVIDSKVISWMDIKNKKIADAIPATQMTKVRKAIQSGIYTKIGGINLLKDFYTVYSCNMLRLGSPVLPLRFFENILKEYKNGDAILLCAYKDKKPVGSGFLMSYEGFFENTWFSTLKDFNHLFPSQFLHHEMIQFAIQHSGHTYSFGRSTSGSGVHEFKRRWNTQETTIFWNYDQPLKADIRKAEFLTRLWRLLPLPVANLLGPLVARRIY